MTLDVEQKYCVHCNHYFPLTKVHWVSPTCSPTCKETRNARRRKHRREHPEYDREDKQRNWERGMANDAKAKDTKIRRFSITTDYITKPYIQFLMKFQEGKCYYCKGIMEHGVGVNRVKNRKAVTLERINNSIQHFTFNCVLCCAKCQGTVNRPTKRLW